MRDRDIPVPASISAAAQAFFETAQPVQHRPVTPGAIAAIREATRAGAIPNAEAMRDAHAEAVADTEIGGVAVQVVVPKGYDAANDGRALLYFHGGGHVVGSPFEDLSITAPLAHRLGIKVYAVQYRLAPEHPFPAALDDATAVYMELLDRLGPSGFAVAGESAGGNLALAVVLRARDAGLALPAAAALMSPWSDLTKTGDSEYVLAGLDPTLDYDLFIADPARAYADGRDLKDPLISPVYADYGPGFPPSLITTGTRDLFMSDCARLSTALRQAGVDAHLHLWEGLWHVFEWYPDLPEAAQSLDEVAAFLQRHWDVA